MNGHIIMHILEAFIIFAGPAVLHTLLVEDAFCKDKIRIF